MTQANTSRCECGALITIRPTVSLWEFEWTCAVCRRGGVISWAHCDPAPHYDPPPLDVLLPLFEAKS